MPFDPEKITIFCFAASYAVALALEVANLVRSTGVWRWGTHIFAAAGLFAHAAYLVHHRLPLGEGPTAPVSLMFLSWILAIFYFYGSIHHRRVAWGVFVLPVVLGLIGLAWVSPPSTVTPDYLPDKSVAGLRFWIGLHIGLLIAGAVGLCVSFVSSVMYLIQHWKLKHKVPPGQGIKLLSLERLEEMSRHGVAWSFPLLTGGLLIGLALLYNTAQLPWHDPKVLSTLALWIVLLLVMVLRYGMRLRGRRVAWLTIVAFAMMLIAYGIQLVLPSSHPSASSERRAASRESRAASRESRVASRARKSLLTTRHSIGGGP